MPCRPAPCPPGSFISPTGGRLQRATTVVIVPLDAAFAKKAVASRWALPAPPLSPPVGQCSPMRGCPTYPTNFRPLRTGQRSSGDCTWRVASLQIGQKRSELSTFPGKDCLDYSPRCCCTAFPHAPVPWQYTVPLCSNAIFIQYSSILAELHTSTVAKCTRRDRGATLDNSQ